ncbi:hypothetical protein A0257_08475 [Hymenobacter psoromatis]|nr:hypothetical protein A0257_08475 [Hymenobacter psoromatis]
MSQRPPVPEPDRRWPVWQVLADMYLDTELQPNELRHTAEVCVVSGFTWLEIKQINYDEVAPALWVNLHDVAGVWGYWDPEWLRARLTASYTGTRHRMLGSESLWRRRVNFYTRDYLVKIEAYFRELSQPAV